LQYERIVEKELSWASQGLKGGLFEARKLGSQGLRRGLSWEGGIEGLRNPNELEGNKEASLLREKDRKRKGRKLGRIGGR
jgi:hypothetical protein